MSYLLVFTQQIKSLRQNRDLQHNALLALASTLITSAIGLVTTPITTHLLPREAFGAFSYAGRLIGLLVAFSAPGISNAISYSVARGYDGEFRRGSMYRLRIYLRNSLLLLPVAIWYYFKEHNTEIAMMLLAGMILSPWFYALDTGDSYLVGLSNFRALFWRRIAVVAIIAFSGVGVALIIQTAAAVFIGKTLVGAVMVGIIYRMLSKTVRNHDLDPEFWQKANNFNMISILSTVGSLTAGLVMGATGDLVALGAYSLSMTLTSPLEIISKSGLKLIYGRMAVTRSVQTQRLWVLLSLVLIMIGIPIVLGGWILIWPIVYWLFPKYPELLIYIPFLVIVNVLMFANILPLSHGLFHNFDLWKRYNIFRNTSLIPLTIIAVLIGGVWGALSIELIYAIADYIIFSNALWNSGK